MTEKIRLRSQAMKNTAHLEKCVDVAHLEKRASFGQMRHI